QAVDQPSPSEPLPSLSHPPLLSATTESEPTPETEVPQSQDPTHPHVAEERTMTVDDLLQLVPKLITKVKKMEDVLKRRHVVLPDLEDEDAEVSSKQGRKLQEEGEEDISPTTLEAAKTLSKVASQRSKSVDKGKRYKRRKESKGKDIDTGFEDISTGFEDISTGFEDISTGFEDISTGFEDISTGFEEVNTGGLGVSTGSGPVSSARGQREGKAPMIVEETQAPKRTKEQIQQEEASLAEAIRLQTLEEEETAKQVHLDALLAKRLAEEEELTEQQKKRKAQVQFEAQHYTEEDWDAIRAKLEANAELTKNVLGKELPEEDFAKKMVELVNQRKKFFAEERAKARRSKPMTQSQLRNYMMNYLKNQGTWKLTQLKKLSFEEVKEEFDKLVKQVESFVPMNIEATKAQLKRYGEELQTEISKKQRIDDKDVSVEEKVTEVKEEEPVIRTGKRKKQKARKGINVDKSPQGDSETDEEESVEAMNPTPLDTKSNIVANWKIFQQGERSIYQIIRANGADTVYMSFGAMLKDFTREDLIELYRLVMQKYGTNRPEDVYDRVLWSDLRTMFDPPLNEDAIWSLPLQQKIISWRYYDKCEVHCLTLEACSIYMLADRKYPLSKDACQVMLKMKLLDGKMNEVCYKLLKMIEKQAGVKQQPNGIFISQDKYVADILKKSDFCSIKIATTPIESNQPLVKDEDGVEVDVHEYRSMIGSLMYLTTSMPDIMFAISACARDSPFELEAFSDSDYEGASLDRKSTTGRCQFLGRRLISWQCKKQTIMTNSTTETEYVAAAHCCGQVLWIQNQMMDYGFTFMNTKIHIDNESTICVVKNPVYHSRTKHIEIRHHFIRDCYEKRLINVLKIHIDSNVVDLLTKGFDVTRISTDLRMDRCSLGTYNSSMVCTSHRTHANGTQQLVASIDSKEYIITEASVRSKLQLADATGIHNLSDAEIYAGLATLGYVTEGDIVPLLPAMLAGAAVDHGEGSAQPAEPHHTPELMVLVPKLVTRINSLEKELKDTKQTLGNVVLKLVKKVKTLETALKRKSKKVLISESEGEESEDQGRKFQDIDDDPLVSLVKESMKLKSIDFVTPTKASREAHEEEICPTILEAAKTLSKVASQGVSKEKSTDKGKRYMRRARSMAKKIDTRLDTKEEINTGREEINTSIEEVSTGSTKVDSGTASERGQREGKAPMIEEDIQATHKTKEQLRQEEVGLEEATKLQAQLDEEVAKQIHLDKMIAKRMAEEEALS
ncbi:hypothetical protein Tco_0720662, partial [Tanacetum coccineum]